jgi:hypothetical protein
MVIGFAWTPERPCGVPTPERGNNPPNAGRRNVERHPLRLGRFDERSEEKSPMGRELSAAEISGREELP